MYLRQPGDYSHRDDQRGVELGANWNGQRSQGAGGHGDSYQKFSSNQIGQLAPVGHREDVAVVEGAQDDAHQRLGPVEAFGGDLWS